MVPSTADMVFCLQHIDAYTECILAMHTVHLSVHRDQIFVLHFHLTQLSPWNFKQLIVFFSQFRSFFFHLKSSRVFIVTMCDTVCTGCDERCMGSNSINILFLVSNTPINNVNKLNRLVFYSLFL